MDICRRIVRVTFGTPLPRMCSVGAVPCRPPASSAASSPASTSPPSSLLCSVGLVRLIIISRDLGLVLQTINRRSCTIAGKAPTRAFSWLKVPTSSFTFKTLCLTGVDPMVSRCEIGCATQLSKGTGGYKTLC